MNLFSRFQKLLPNHPLRVGTVLGIDGTSLLLEEVGGALVTIRGSAAVGARVYFKDGVFDSLAPDLPLEVIEE